MKTYNKEKLHEYAKELFALCLEKGLIFSLSNNGQIITLYLGSISVKNMMCTYICEDMYNYTDSITMPIYRLIKKVKQM